MTPKKLYLKTISIFVITVLMLAVMTAQPARAETFSVIVTTDDLTDNGNCTLREAIIAANTNTAVDACPAGSDTETDIITLTNGAIYSLTIGVVDEDLSAAGDLDITNNAAAIDLQIVVAGGGTATISQDATPDDRVIHIHAATVEMTGVIITGGDTASSYITDGGGINNDYGALTLTNCVVSNNSSGGHGGGIFSHWGSLTVQDGSSIDNNTSGYYGGGIRGLATTLIVDGSTISNNKATLDSGGIDVDSSDVTIRNGSTITGNNAGRKGGGVFIIQWGGGRGPHCNHRCQHD